MVFPVPILCDARIYCAQKHVKRINQRDLKLHYLTPEDLLHLQNDVVQDDTESFFIYILHQRPKPEFQGWMYFTVDHKLAKLLQYLLLKQYLTICDFHTHCKWLIEHADDRMLYLLIKHFAQQGVNIDQMFVTTIA